MMVPQGVSTQPRVAIGPQYIKMHSVSSQHRSSHALAASGQVSHIQALHVSLAPSGGVQIGPDGAASTVGTVDAAPDEDVGTGEAPPCPPDDEAPPAEPRVPKSSGPSLAQPGASARASAAARVVTLVEIRVIQPRI
jgi:hypothetical protein